MNPSVAMKLPSAFNYSNMKEDGGLLPPFSRVAPDETMSCQNIPKPKQYQKPKSKIATKRTGRPKGRRTTSHSHLIRPKRPRSAYNFFFRDERNKIVRAAGLKVIDHEEPVSTSKNSTSSDHFQILVTNTNQENGKRKRGRPRGSHYRPRRKVERHGLVDFRDLAKTAGTKWKSLSTEAKIPYEELAKLDLAKYRSAMKRYNAEVQIYEHLNAPDEPASLDSAKMNMQEPSDNNIHNGYDSSCSAVKSDFDSCLSDEQKPICLSSSLISDFEMQEQNTGSDTKDNDNGIRKIFELDESATTTLTSSTITSILSPLLREALDQTDLNCETQQQQNTPICCSMIPKSCVPKCDIISKDFEPLLDEISTRVNVIQNNTGQFYSLESD